MALLKIILLRVCKITLTNLNPSQKKIVEKYVKKISEFIMRKMFSRLINAYKDI